MHSIRWCRALAWCFIGLIYISLPNQGMGQTLSEYLQYHVIPSCDSPNPLKPTLANQFYLELMVTGLSEAEDDFEVYIDREAVLQFHVDSSQLPFRRLVGPFNHSRVGGTYREYIIQSLSLPQSDTLFLPELVCGHSTSNGLNSAGYYCNPDIYGVIAQVTPEALDAPEMPEKTYVYVLVNAISGHVEEKNFSGHFDEVTDLTNYEIHAFSVPFDKQDTFINGIIIGEELDQNSLDICYALCGVFDVMVDCSSFDMSLEKRVRGPFVYEIGDTVIFDIVVTNDGSITAYNIIVEDMPPSALDFLPDLSSAWNADLTSVTIDSLAAGASIVLPIYMRVNGNTDEIEVVNSAEIVLATADPESDIPAFDVDSMPDNEEEDEDDQDDEEIIILEKLCAATFDITADNMPVCEDQPLVLMAAVNMASFPLNYTWRKDGDVISRDSVIIIEDHGPQDYGSYSLTIRDANNCVGTEFVYLEPIDNDIRFSCLTDINVGVNNDCEMFLSPDMFTTRTVSGIKDYTIEIRDAAGNLVDQLDLSIYPPGTILEAKIINPCNGSVICWSNLHIESKVTPDFDYYKDEFVVAYCVEEDIRNVAGIIDHFNEVFSDQILSAIEFQELLNAAVCLQNWEVEIEDQIESSASECGSQELTRVYYIYNQEQRLEIDRAVIRIEKIEVDSIYIPDDLVNISCLQDVSPELLGSFPSYQLGDTSIFLGAFQKGVGVACNLGVSYSDQNFNSVCKFGSYKIARQWSVIDWCSNKVLEDVQYLYVVDKVAPQIYVEEDTVYVFTAPFECMAAVDVRNYVAAEDLCDIDPQIFVNGLRVERTSVEMPLGYHSLEIIARDNCGNESKVQLELSVQEETQPVPVLNETLTISLVGDNNDREVVRAEFLMLVVMIIYVDLWL